MKLNSCPPPPYLLEHFCLQFLPAGSFSSDCYRLIPNSCRAISEHLKILIFTAFVALVFALYRFGEGRGRGGTLRTSITMSLFLDKESLSVI